MLTSLSHAWPSYVSGSLMGVVAIALLLHGNRMLGVSASFRTMCAVIAPGRAEFFHFDWRRTGAWNLAFVCGIALGGFLSVRFLGAGHPVPLSTDMQRDLAALGITHVTGLVPPELFSWHAALGARGLLMLGGGGFLVGFGAMWAGGCTSGHGILGLADLQLPSLVAVAGFFTGGILTSRLLLPLLL